MHVSDHISIAPLQSFTDFRFRKAFFQFFGGVDKCYAPYIKLTNQKEIKNAQQKDILIENNPIITVMPQLMVNSADDFLMVANYVQSLGYDEINWNMGCPYPMVAKRNLGAGMLNDPDGIDRLLDDIFSKSNIKLGLKMRMGYESTEEILKVIPVLNKYPITELIIHARFAKQLYKPSVDLNRFEECISISKTPLTYNGDLNTVEDFRALKERFPTINNWMIGRGLVKDPFLAQMIKDDTTEYPEDRWEIFKKFHDELYEDYASVLHGDHQVRLKMLGFWEYFSESFTNSHKSLKRIKKAKNIYAFDQAVAENFDIQMSL